nr:hypothetical protein [Tanacetum cinerariifolium]
MEDNISASPTPTLRIYKDHLKTQIISPVDTPVQTRTKSKEVEEHSFIATIYQKTNPALLQFCLFLWVRPIGTKWVLKNKKDKRGIVIRNKARLVAQWHTQEEGIDYDEVFVPVARIEAIRLFLAYALFIGFTVYQIDVKSAFLYGTIDEEVYMVQPPGFQDPEFPARVYKVEKAMYGLHQAPRAWYGTLSKYLLTNGFQRGTIDQTLFIKRKRGDFILVQVYVDDIIFGSSNPQLSREFEALMHEKFQMSAMDELNFFLDVRSSNTPMDKENPWGKYGTRKDVDLHLYIYMIGSLMYLTASRPDIMFAVCACARHQVTPKECHLHAVKRIFRYLKGHPKLRLWYPKESPFDLVAYSDSDYGGASQDRKSTTGESASGCGQVLWIQNQLLDYGDCFEKKLCSVDHIHKDENVTDLLTKPFDAGRFQYLVFWSTARIETTDEGTKILATLDAGSKDRPPMLAPGNYIQWKSRIKRYIDAKPNRELINYCLENPSYELGWNDKPVLDSEGNPTTVTARVFETYKNVTFYMMMNEITRNQCKVTNHQVNVQFLLQLQQEWQRFVTLMKQSQELKNVSYHKLYDILKQHQHEVNEIRAEKIARVANPLALVAQQQQVYHP